MDAGIQPAPRKNKAAWLKASEVILSMVGAIVILACLYRIAVWSNHVDLYSPTTTAVGGFVTCLALLWSLTGQFAGPGALHQADMDQGSRFIATAGVIITIGGVLADEHLGWPGLGAVALASLISFVALLGAFFGLASRRQRIDDKAANQANPTN